MEKYFIVGLTVLLIVEGAFFLYQKDKLKKNYRKEIGRLNSELSKVQRGLSVTENSYLFLMKGVVGIDAKGDSHRFVYVNGDRIVSVSHGFRHKSFTKEQLGKFFTNSTCDDIYATFGFKC